MLLVVLHKILGLHTKSSFHMVTKLGWAICYVTTGVVAALDVSRTLSQLFSVMIIFF